MTELIALDWGTTSLRAYRASAAGTVLERRESRAGILHVDGDFAGALRAAIGDWLAAAPAAPVIMAGMIGSRQGWREVAYVPCPADAAALAHGLERIEGALDRPIHVVPGISCVEDGIPDVMRGEETQILGECALRRLDDGVLLLPGTHSKWALVEGSRITGFRTYMTGELFDLLRRHSILGRMIEGEAHDEAGFARGVGHGVAAGADLSHALFAARTLALMGDLAPAAVASFLSGLLIGAETASGRRWTRDPVVVIGSGELTDRYLTALRIAGAEATAGTPDAAVHGLVHLAEAAGLLEPHHA